MLPTQKVKIFNNNLPINAINSFLEKRKDRSENTYINYRNNISEFFEHISNKPIETLTWDDILKITYQDVDLYMQYLKNNKGNSAKTVNAKISAVKMLYKNGLKKYNDKINLNVIDIEFEFIKNKTDNSWGSLTEDEVYRLMDFCQNRPKNSKPIIQKLAFKGLFITAIRHEALLKAKYKDLKKIKDNKTGNYIYAIKVYDKGKEVTEAIPDSFYDELLKVKIDDDSKIFDITAQSLNKTLKLFCKYNNISDDRRIVLHSIKKASGNYVYKITNGDIVKTAEHLKHSNINTTYSHYLDKNKDLSNRASFKMFNQKTDITEIESLSKEEIIDLIREAGEDVLIALTSIKRQKEKI